MTVLREGFVAPKRPDALNVRFRKRELTSALGRPESVIDCLKPTIGDIGAAILLVMHNTTLVLSCGSL